MIKRKLGAYNKAFNIIKNITSSLCRMSSFITHKRRALCSENKMIFNLIFFTFKLILKLNISVLCKPGIYANAG
jgi:hypothetical protein